MSKAAAKKATTDKTAKAPVTLKTNPYPVQTLRSLPTVMGRERTNYGWEDLVKPRQFKRIPASEIDRASPSAYNFFKRHADDETGPFARTEAGPCKVTIMQAKDADGHVIPLMDDEGNVVTDKRGRPLPAFYDVIRVR